MNIICTHPRLCVCVCVVASCWTCWAALVVADSATKVCWKPGRLWAHRPLRLPPSATTQLPFPSPSPTRALPSPRAGTPAGVSVLPSHVLGSCGGNVSVPHPCGGRRWRPEHHRGRHSHGAMHCPPRACTPACVHAAVGSPCTPHLPLPPFLLPSLTPSLPHSLYTSLFPLHVQGVAIEAALMEVITTLMAAMQHQGTRTAGVPRHPSIGGCVPRPCVGWSACFCRV